MTKQAMRDFAAVVTTLAETNGPAIASMIYLALGSDMQRYEVVKKMLRATEAATVTSTTLEITTKGREIARQIEEALAASS